ncbi:MAG: hypothetical protein ABR548_01085 [Actinomycetota bacterium]
MHRRRRRFLGPALLCLSVFAAANGAAFADTTTGIGTATAGAIPLQISLGGTTVDLLNILLSATSDPVRAGTAGPAASAHLTAMEASGLTNTSAGTLDSSANDAEGDTEQAADVPLLVPGVVSGTLQSATAHSAVDANGSRANVGATISNVSLGGSLIAIDSATASMSVDVSSVGSVAEKVLDLPSVAVLRVGDLAAIAGTTIGSLPVDSLLSIANELQLAATGTFGAILAQEENVQAQIDSLQADLDAVLAQRDDVTAQLSGAESDFAAKQAALSDAQDVVATVTTAVSQAQQDVDNATAAVADGQTAVTSAQAQVDAAEAALTSSQSALAGAQADQSTTNSLTLLTSGAITTLQTLANKYGVPVTVSPLNFLTALSSVQTAINAAVANAQTAVNARQTDLDAAETTLASGQASLASAQATLASTVAAMASAESDLSSDQAVVAALQSAVEDLQSSIASLGDTLASLDSTISADEGALEGLQSLLDDVIAQLTAFVDDLEGAVTTAAVISFSGVRITLRATADGETGTPEVEMSFAAMNIGNVQVASDVTSLDAVGDLLPQVQDTVNEVGGSLGLAPASVGMFEPSQSSGADGDYHFASASFTLFRLSVPVPTGGTLELSVGDPQVYAEFAPATGAGEGGGNAGGDGGETGSGDSGGNGGGGSVGGGSGTGGGSGGGALLGSPLPDGGKLPVTGIPDRTRAGMAAIAAALLLGVATARRERVEHARL